MFWLTCSDYTHVLVTFAHEAMGAAKHPAFPAPSFFEGGSLNHLDAFRVAGSRTRILFAV
jgi:hypothetical protein